MNRTVIDVVAERLKDQYSDLSLDEGRVLAHAYVIRNGQSRAVIGNPRTAPAGYFDSTIGLSFLDSPSLIHEFCEHLVSVGYLTNHDSEIGMVKISGHMIPVCEQIVNSIF